MENYNASGSCLCGAVSYKVNEPPRWSAHCHCQSCRRHTGSAVASFVGFARTAVNFSSGPPAQYASSPGVQRLFCSQCGTPIAYQTDRLPDEIHLYLGGLHKPEDYPAQFHVFCAEALPWFAISDEATRYDTLP